MVPCAAEWARTEYRVDLQSGRTCAAIELPYGKVLKTVDHTCMRFRGKAFRAATGEDLKSYSVWFRPGCNYMRCVYVRHVFNEHRASLRSFGSVSLPPR